MPMPMPMTGVNQQTRRPSARSPRSYIRLFLATPATSLLLMSLSSCAGYEFDPNFFGGKPQSAQPTPPTVNASEEGLPQKSEPSASTHEQDPQALRADMTALATQGRAKKDGDIESVLTHQRFPGLYQHFSPQLLAAVNVIVTRDLPIPHTHPSKVGGVIGSIGTLFNQTHNDAMAITYGRNIYVKPEHFNEGVMFHEMVHVLQYEELGTETFIAWYSYFHAQHGKHNPLETMAYQLEANFVAKAALPDDMVRHVRAELQRIKP